MGKLATEQIADWIERDIQNDDWLSLRAVCYEVLRKNIEISSEDELLELAEERTPYLPEILADRLATISEDGSTATFELDEPNSYIRRCNSQYGSLVDKLRLVHPTRFEHICAEILGKLGGESGVTPITNDGGVDFWAFNLRHVVPALPFPRAASFAVVGQAKRYGESHLVSETELRGFIGGGLLKVHEYRKLGKVATLQPVIYAFWTSSRLHKNAKNYARSMGIWDMDGLAMVDYLVKLDLLAELN